MYPNDTYSTFKIANPITDPLLRRLCRRLDVCGGSEEYIAVIRKIVRTRDPQAMEVLAALLDSPGPVGRAAAKGLVRFGLAAVPEIQHVLRDSLDVDALHHASWVMKRLNPLEPVALAA